MGRSRIYRDRSIERSLMMMKRYFIPLIIGLFLIVANGIRCETISQDITINTTVALRGKITLGTSTINFPDGDPDTMSSISATENPVAVNAKAQVNGGDSVVLQVLAKGDLISGSDSIAISNITWTATGDSFQGGTMSRETSQTAGSWVGAGNRSGTFSYFLANSWDYATGNYNQTVTYSLVSP